MDVINKDNVPYLAYKELTKVREQANSFRKASFKNRILKFRRSKPNPKTGGYFVSHNGLPDNSGLIFDEPIDLATFKKLELWPYDKCYFERGQIYNFTEKTVTVNNVTFGAYGTGADPKFYGSTSLSGAVFTSETGGYYSTPLATAPLWVANPAGEMARQGETDWIPVTAVPSGTQRTFLAATLNAFNSVEALTTAKARFPKEFNFRGSFEYTIPTYNTGTGVVTFNTTVPGAAIGYGMKLYGQKQFATLEGDWWYDDTANELWIKAAADPTGLDWRVVTENSAFVLNATGTTITGIDITQYYESGIEAFRASNTSITADIHDIRTDGIFLYGNNTGTISFNGTITRCGLNGFNVGGVSGLRISGSVTSIGKQLNYPWAINTSILKTGGCALACFTDTSDPNELASDIQVTEFEASDLAYMGCLFLGTNHLAEHCHIYDGLLRFDDGGGLYCYYQASFLGLGTSGNVFRDCIVHGMLGSHEGIANYTQQSFASGIYLDAGCNNTEVDGCSLFDNTFFGVFSNYNTEETYVHDSLLANNLGGGIFFYEQPDAPTSAIFLNNYKNTVETNVFVCGANEMAIYAASDGPSRNVNYVPYTTGFADNNTYYMQNQRHTSNSVPTALNAVAKFESSATNFMAGTAAATFTYFNLASWVIRNTSDGTSTSSGFYLDNSGPSNAIDQIPVMFNPTGTTAAKTLTSNTYNDLAGATLNGANVAAWSAVPGVIKPTYFYLMENFLGTSGSAVTTGRAPKIGNTANVLAGTHTINAGGALASSVAGLITWDLGVTNVQYEVFKFCDNIIASLREDLRLADNTTSVNSRIIVDCTGTDVRVRENSGGGLNTIATAPFVHAINTNYRFRYVLNGSNLQIFINGTLYINTTVTVLTGNWFGLLAEVTRFTSFLVAYP